MQEECCGKDGLRRAKAEILLDGKKGDLAL
jgi:hypothetical protein